MGTPNFQNKELKTIEKAMEKRISKEGFISEEEFFSEFFPFILKRENWENEDWVVLFPEKFATILNGEFPKSFRIMRALSDRVLAYIRITDWD